MNQTNTYYELGFAIFLVAIAAAAGVHYGSDGWGAESESKIGFNSAFCELMQDGLIREPANTWSNLAYVIVGFGVLWHIGYLGGPRNNPMDGRSQYNILYCYSAVILGIGSFAMHATKTDWGGWLDNTGMVLFVSFPVVYNFTRILKWNDKTFLWSYLGLNILISAFIWFVGHGSYIFAILTVCWMCTEAGIRYPQKSWIVFGVPALFDLVLRGGDLAWTQLIWIAMAFWFAQFKQIEIKRSYVPAFWLGFGSYISAFIIWNLSLEDGLLCDPASLMQGHALWHILTACSIGFFYIYLRSEQKVSIPEEKKVDAITEVFNSLLNFKFPWDD